VYLRLDGHPEEGEDELMQAYEDAGFPVVRLHLHDAYDLGGQFFLWEMAIAVAGHLLGINPFDQPDVEAAKIRAREMINAYVETGTLPHETPVLTDEGITVYGDLPAGSEQNEAVSPAGRALLAFLTQGQPGAYVALQAYLAPTVEVNAALRSLSARLRDRFHLATTVGYGPRYLHSTGQLHKGDAGHGLFIQFTADDLRDAPIPDEAGSPGSSITFGLLKAAQALGDRQALQNAGRRVIRFHLGTKVNDGLNRLNKALL
jgi:transaldolase/glucose-6-phosphate isomerase